MDFETREKQVSCSVTSGTYETDGVATLTAEEIARVKTATDTEAAKAALNLIAAEYGGETNDIFSCRWFDVNPREITINSGDTVETRYPILRGLEDIYVRSIKVRMRMSNE